MKKQQNVDQYKKTLPISIGYNVFISSSPKWNELMQQRMQQIRSIDDRLHLDNPRPGIFHFNNNVIKNKDFLKSNLTPSYQSIHYLKNTKTIEEDSNPKSP